MMEDKHDENTFIVPHIIWSVNLGNTTNENGDIITMAAVLTRNESNAVSLSFNEDLDGTFYMTSFLAGDGSF